MRELMATKRERQRRLVELVNMLRPESEKIKGSARIEFERVHAARWLSVNDERQDEAREQLGRRLKANERRALIAKFWEDVDAELNELEEFIRDEIRKPLHQRAPQGYKFKLQPKKGK